MRILNRRSLCLGALALAGCSNTRSGRPFSLPETTRNAQPLPTPALAAALSEIESATGSDGISASVVRPGGEIWSGETGRGAEAWGSVTKVPVAAAVVALADDGLWSLNDPIGKYVPLSWGDRASLSDLLGHTGGLPRDIDNAEAAVQSSEQERAALDALKQERTGSFSYSNAGYRALGLAIEAVSNHPWQDEVQDRALKPTGAQQLGFPSRSASTALAAPGAAGSLRGPAPEVAQFLSDLLSGRLLAPDGLEAMLNPFNNGTDPVLSYSRGLMLFDLPDGTTWLGHSGSTGEGRAVAVWIPEKNAIVALALRGTGSAEAAANLIRNAI